MSPRVNKENVIFLLNVGTTANDYDTDGRSFFEKAKEFIRLMIERKILLHPNDEIAIILMGASETDNGSDLDNTKVLSPLQKTSWETIESLMTVESTTESVDWINGLLVALSYMEHECIDATAKVLVMLTNFEEDADVVEQYDAHTLIKDISKQNFNLLSIIDKSRDNDSQQYISASEKLFTEVCNTVGGQMMTFEDTLKKLRFFKQIHKTVPWNVDMDLCVASIPVAMYLRVTQTSKMRSWRLVTNIDGMERKVHKINVKVDKSKNIIPKENIITGYMYGRKFVPFSEEDEKAMKYESGPKGFIIYGFAEKSSVKLECLAGRGSYVILPKFPWAAEIFYALVHAMIRLDKVAIVRRVYRTNTAPKMGILIPRMNEPDDLSCLVYIEIAFAEDIRTIPAGSVKSTMNKLTGWEEAAVDELLDSMNLMHVEDDQTGTTYEAFKCGTVNNPSQQHIWNLLSFRAINPGDPLPPVKDYLQEVADVPASVKLKRDAALKNVARFFPIEKVPPKLKPEKEPWDDLVEVNAFDEPSVSGVAIEENLCDEREEKRTLPAVEQESDMDFEDLIVQM